MRKIVLIAFALFVAVFAVVSIKPKTVYAQCSSCSGVGDEGSCDACGGRFFCTCGCDVLCYPPNNCACEATLCWYVVEANCSVCGIDPLYGTCLSCPVQACGGTPENCSFNCPDSYSPCLNECDGGPRRDPTPTPTPEPAPPDNPPSVPNCSALSGPSDISLGNSGTYSANFSSTDGNLSGEIFYNSVAGTISGIQGLPGTSGSISASWTPPAAGSYEVCCRAWNDAVAECRPPSLVDGPPRYPCVGPNYCKTVNVQSQCSAPTLAGGGSCDGSDGLIDITWTWNSVSGASGYIINIDNNPDFSSPELSVFISGTSYTSTNLVPGTWYGRVRVNTADSGTCIAPSAWSSTASVTNLCASCAAPVNNAPASACINQTMYDTTWYFNESAGANEYQFVVSNHNSATCPSSNFFDCVVYSSGWQPSAFFSCAGGSCNLPMTGFTSGTRYYSLVQARGLSCPLSSWSNEQNVFEDCYLACPAPILSSSGSTCDTGDTLVDITWQWNDLAASGATSYRLQVDRAPADWVIMPYNLVLTPGVNLTCNGVTCSYTTTDLNPGTWDARVIVLTSDGIGCTVNPVGWSATASASDACLTQVTGQGFNDPFGEALPAGFGGMCQLVGASGVQPGAGSSVTVNPGGYVDPNINLDGTFAVPAVPPNIPPGAGYTSALDPAGDWACTCPSTCLYSVDVPQDIPPDEALRYYVSEIQDTWFQTVGGDVHAEGNILSSIPATCSGLCVPEFSLPGGDEVGVVTSSTGSVSFGSGSVSSQSWEATSIYNGPRYLFDFWRKETDTPTLLADLDGRPSPPQGIYEITSTSDLTLTGNWNNLPQELTIFVNFSDPGYSLILNPDNPGITINPGGLLTIITNGNIRVAYTA